MSSALASQLVGAGWTGGFESGGISEHAPSLTVPLLGDCVNRHNLTLAKCAPLQYGELGKLCVSTNPDCLEGRTSLPLI